MQVPQNVLAWERRSPQILQEIGESGADLVCLQEVNRYGRPLSAPKLPELSHDAQSIEVQCNGSPCASTCIGGEVDNRLHMCLCRGLLQTAYGELGIHRHLLAKGLLACRTVWIPLRRMRALLPSHPL